MPRPIKKKVKKRDIGSEDELRDTLHDFREKLRKKKKTVLVYSVIALSAVLVFGVIFFYQHTSEKDARALETRAYNSYYNLYQQRNLPNQERFQLALNLFQQAYSKRKSPRVLLYIASCYYELEKYDDALKTLNDFTKKYKTAKDLLPIAYRKTAAIQLIKHDKEAVLKTLDTLYKSGPVFQDYALIESGRILEQEGKTSEAAEKFRELAEKFPGSPFAEEAKAKLGEKKEG
ncbi:MAG: tetratricopeptide repeat protein [Nitrospirota bacterium]|nr:tetratricopeptide repeat protein [Nitrospirota bacterium]